MGGSDKGLWATTQGKESIVDNQQNQQAAAPPQQQQQYVPPGMVPVQPVQYVQAVPGKSTPGLAIAGFVLSIVWLYWVGSVLAVIFCGIVLHKSKQEPGRYNTGLAIAGLVLGIVGLVVLLLVFVLVWSVDAGSTSGGLSDAFNE